PPDFEALRARLVERAGAAPGEVSVALVDLETGGRIGIGDDVVMHAASTMKVPLLLELFRQTAAGGAGLRDSIPVRNEFTSIADGSRYSLTPDDDSEHALYRLVGRKLPREELARRMIVRSSNLATNILIEEVGADAVRRLMAGLGAEGMQVLRGVEDTPAYRRGMNNTTTAGALARVLEVIARCEGGDVAAPLRPLTPSHCARITAILGDQQFTDRIPAGVPAGVKVANKTGWITAIDHDGAIIYPPGRAPYVLVVLTRGMEDDDVSARAIRDISRMAWQELGTAHLPSAEGAAPAELAALQRLHRVDGLEDRKFDHATYWSVVTPFIEHAPDLSAELIGRSVEGRPIRAVSYGTGPTSVLLWSQMHGDEPTASMALADIFAFLAADPEHPLAARLRDRLTVVAVPMLNPDGAERFQRRNAYGIDINRDARALVTPEARALKALRDRLEPTFGFNLHDQNVRTRVGDSAEGAAIALLAPPWSHTRDDDAVRERAKRVAAVVRLAVDSLVAGRVTRYDDGYNARAFGDLMQQWGTSTVLIESGGWGGDPEKQHLRLANFVGILAALDAIASGSHQDVDPDWYETLPRNGAQAVDLVLRGGSVVAPALPPFRADVALEYSESSRLIGPSVVDIGDLRDAVTRNELTIDGLYAHLELARRVEGEERTGSGLLGRVRRIVVREGEEPDSRPVWIIEDGVPVSAGR
ncbi:MAG TPA: serine hydrolase, partial [Longimicrobiales bacterium]|nr:serine hydrolase [Longimicrobiales bacterium]